MNFIAQRVMDQREASLRPPLGVVPPGAVSLALGEPDFAPPQEVIDAIHSPIGLPIGGETPEEIAVSVAAELIAHRSGKLSRHA